MREIQVKCLTSLPKQQRSIDVNERMEQDEFTTTITRQCVYRVDFAVPLMFNGSAVWWAWKYPAKKSDGRTVHVTKSMDPSSGSERVRYAVRGSFYVIMNLMLYRITYKHVLKMDVATS